MQWRQAACGGPGIVALQQFRGYARKSKQVDWIAYDQLHTYWNASVGGTDAARAYRKYVKEGLHVGKIRSRTSCENGFLEAKTFFAG
jgi:hypothetical protein